MGLTPNLFYSDFYVMTKGSELYRLGPTQKVQVLSKLEQKTHTPYSDQKIPLICGNKMPTRCNRCFYCRSYCLLNMFRASLCPSSGAQEYYTVVAACGISCCGFFKQLVWCGAEGYASGLQDAAIKTSVASSWHFISTY